MSQLSLMYWQPQESSSSLCLSQLYILFILFVFVPCLFRLLFCFQLSSSFYFYNLRPSNIFSFLFIALSISCDVLYTFITFFSVSFYLIVINSSPKIENLKNTTNKLVLTNQRNNTKSIKRFF